MNRIFLFLATLGFHLWKAPAPGTLGSLFGFIVCWFIGPIPVSFLSLTFIPVALLIAVFIATRAEAILKCPDPGIVVIDEYIVIPICLLGISWEAPWLVFSLAFVLFRVFDIFKPLGIGQIQKLPKGWGIVADDLLAAIYTNLVLRGILFFL